MNNNLTLLPTEVEQIAKNVSSEKKTEVQTVLNQVFDGVSKMREQLDSVVVSDENDKVNMKIANTIRLGVRKVRLDAEKVFDQKRQEVQLQMSAFKTEDQLWLKAKQTMQILTKEIEENARWKEETRLRFDAEQKELKIQQRIISLSTIAPNVNRSEFENMSDDSFSLYYSALEKEYNDRIEAEKKAEQERLRLEEIERLRWYRSDLIKPYYQFFEEGNTKLGELSESEFENLLEILKGQKKAHDEKIEAQRIENERLKAEAEEKERQLAEEKAKAELERKMLEEKARKEQEAANKKLAEERAKQEAILKAEREAKAKLEAEIKAKKDAEEKARIEEQNRIIAEQKAQKEAEDKARKAPDKEKLLQFAQMLNSISSPELKSDEANKIMQDSLGLIAKVSKYITEKTDKM